jgi:hypothetical protein
VDIKDATLMMISESADHPADAITGPIVTEIGRQAPVKSSGYSRPADPETDPLLAPAWPPR